MLMVLDVSVSGKERERMLFLWQNVLMCVSFGFIRISRHYFRSTGSHPVGFLRRCFKKKARKRERA
jgi:hypothetical protein